MDVNQKSLELHYELGGKIEVVSRKPVETSEDYPCSIPPVWQSPAARSPRITASRLS